MKISDTDIAEPGSATGRRVIGDGGGLFLSRMQGETGVDIGACYQCERCTNACPVAGYMDIKPHQVIRYTQLGWRRELMRSVTIWVCLSCEMCTTYCPNEVDVAELINHLRTMAARSSVEPREKDLAQFHHVFLNELQRFGRVNELWLMAAYNRRLNVLKGKIKDGSLAEDLRLGYTLWRKGRLKLLPHRSKAIQDIRRLYRRREIL